MPRQARTISATNVYHAILRGVNKQQVFEDDEDYIRFLNVLRRQTQPDVDAQGQTFQSRCHVYAYCLMGNHVHLLLKEGSETIGDIMKRIASSYVYYYNHKYDRVGHLFQEREEEFVKFIKQYGFYADFEYVDRPTNISFIIQEIMESTARLNTH